jgi:hypothetical protein
MASAYCVQFSFLLPNMKPRLVSDASGILFRATEFLIDPIYMAAYAKLLDPHFATASKLCFSRLFLERKAGDMIVA